MIRTRHRDHK